MAGRNYLSIQEFASAIPNHLLLGSLLEHLCFVYESNPARSRMLFKGTRVYSPKSYYKPFQTNKKSGYNFSSGLCLPSLFLAITVTFQI